MLSIEPHQIPQSLGALPQFLRVRNLEWLSWEALAQCVTRGCAQAIDRIYIIKSMKGLEERPQWKLQHFCNPASEVTTHGFCCIHTVQPILKERGVTSGCKVTMCHPGVWLPWPLSIEFKREAWAFLSDIHSACGSLRNYLSSLGICLPKGVVPELSLGQCQVSPGSCPLMHLWTHRLGGSTVTHRTHPHAYLCCLHTAQGF